MEPNEVFASVQPFTGLPQVVDSEAPAVLADAVAQREIAEVQAAMTIAKRFPRNQAKALDRIMVACQRPTLAEGALYSYARGGTDITGPSIRLAEAIAQQWGNLQFGIRELDQRAGESTVEAFAWDLETNTRQTKTFQVKHYRHTKKGGYNLSDPRDIYELVANQGARRLRACILGVIPGDIVEAAQVQCEVTLNAKADISPETVKKMVELFASFKVSKEMIEARIQRRLESITPAQIISLRKVYNSLKDGMSKAADWFDTSAPAPEPEKPERRQKAPEPPPTEPEPEAAVAPTVKSEVPPSEASEPPDPIFAELSRVPEDVLMKAFKAAKMDYRPLTELDQESAEKLAGYARLL